MDCLWKVGGKLIEAIGIMLKLNTLQINVAQLLKSDIGTTRAYVVEEEVDIAGKSRMVHGEVKLTRSDRSILVKGRLHLEIELTCSRCLSVFGYPLSFDIVEEFLPKIDISTGHALPPPEDDEAFTITDRNILDLIEAVRQYALMAIPMKPLCRPNCTGLCPVCGCNLNRGACSCPPEPIDPRWAKLRELISADNKTLMNEREGMK